MRQKWQRALLLKCTTFLIKVIQLVARNSRYKVNGYCDIPRAKADTRAKLLCKSTSILPSHILVQNRECKLYHVTDAYRFAKRL